MQAILVQLQLIFHIMKFIWLDTPGVSATGLMTIEVLAAYNEAIAVPLLKTNHVCWLSAPAQNGTERSWINV